MARWSPCGSLLPPSLDVSRPARNLRPGPKRPATQPQSPAQHRPPQRRPQHPTIGAQAPSCLYSQQPCLQERRLEERAQRLHPLRPLDNLRSHPSINEEMLGLHDQCGRDGAACRDVLLVTACCFKSVRCAPSRPDEQLPGPHECPVVLATQPTLLTESVALCSTCWQRHPTHDTRRPTRNQSHHQPAHLSIQHVRRLWTAFHQRQARARDLQACSGYMHVVDRICRNGWPIAA
jgi:hypothetical protein